MTFVKTNKPRNTGKKARNQGWGHLGHLPPRNFQNIAQQFWHLQKLSKNKDEILYSNNFSENSYLNFSLSYGQNISLQDLP